MMSSSFFPLLSHQSTKEPLIAARRGRGREGEEEGQIALGIWEYGAGWLVVGGGGRG